MELGYLGMGLFGESPFGFELLGLLGGEIHGFNELGFGGKNRFFGVLRLNSDHPCETSY